MPSPDQSPSGSRGEARRQRRRCPGRSRRSRRGPGESPARSAEPVAGLGRGGSSAAGAELFDGLSPTQAAILITRYTRPSHLVLDLTGDLAVEGVAGAGGRRYANVHPAAVPVMLDAHRRGQWPTAHLILLRGSSDSAHLDSGSPVVAQRPDQPPRSAAGDEPGTLTGLLRDLAHLLHPSGHLVVTTVASQGEQEHGGSPVLASLMVAAPRSGLRLTRRHVITQTSAHDEAGTAAQSDQQERRGASSAGTSSAQTELFVLTHRDRDG